ncbi:dihydroorotate dehydrogenase electron transfer subunit [Thermococcus cleftensis]|uniref:Probable dihydroorotate dehydrogenase B (NAD(+)), electron transfer subunit n=1 Tax=Thermococcus cleftensis (strain DSM 27260 / KACC 17922 / CL1) TaxID=163003 RepID=I3ZTT9_THECF|nr:dihydroorotate dehydrogenase electron transfer subunit [Thermococcus cleftensis]AFL95123.1 dihydroorotate dehydrogenase electron transfer subunit [Thermococcus cleftensis]
MLERVTLREVWDVARDVKAFRFDKKLKFTAGQFIMTWLPGVGEKPFSLAWRDLIVVKRVGPFTSRLFELAEGDHLWIRGPYGRGFKPEGEKVALVGGGIGIPPLYAFVRQNSGRFKSITLIYGARSREELALMDIEEYVDEVIITTDDGSAGRKGFPTDVLAERKNEFDQVYACGPEPMLKAVLEVMNYENVQVSAERYMKCGIGVCGSCNLGKYLVCRDGPVFDGFQLRGLL